MTTGSAESSDTASFAEAPASAAPAAVREVLDLFGRRGDGTYGEAVDQRRHALQCADRAVATGAPDALVAAALLHDIGHLLSGPDVPGVDRTTEDDRHEAVGARFLAPRFGPDVSRPVALHVMAKRYRCTVDPDYYGGLSPPRGPPWWPRAVGSTPGLWPASNVFRVSSTPSPYGTGTNRRKTRPGMSPASTRTSPCCGGWPTPSGRRRHETPDRTAPDRQVGGRPRPGPLNVTARTPDQP